MRKPTTYFEQVPLALAKKIAEQEVASSAITCAICNHAVALEKCKIDEDGKAVHDDCYLTKLARAIDTPLSSSSPKDHRGTT